MKQPVNFRLDKVSIATLEALTQALGVSRTKVVEEALSFYARKKTGKKNPLMKYAGALSDRDAKAMLEIIRERRNKTDVPLL